MKCVCWTLGTVLLAVALVGSTSAGADDSPGAKDAIPEPTQTEDDSVDKTKKLSLKELQALKARNRLEKGVRDKLRRLTIVPRGERTVEDYFVVGKAEINSQDQAAQVRFAMVHGLDEAAKEVTDYLVQTPPGSLRDWQAISRFKNEEGAQAALADVRQRYDNLVAYRAELMKLYAASSITRC